MKRFPALLVLFSVISCHRPGSPSGKPPLNLPDLRMTTFQNESVRTADLRGDVAFLDFWTLACAPCNDMRRSAERLNPEFGARGVRFLAINEDAAPAEWSRFLSLNPSPQIEVQDRVRRLGTALGVTELPAVFLIDRRGRVRWRRTGWTGDSESEAARQLRGLLAESQPPLTGRH